jgi:hypothetical protein
LPEPEDWSTDRAGDERRADDDRLVSGDRGDEAHDEVGEGDQREDAEQPWLAGSAQEEQADDQEPDRRQREAHHTQGVDWRGRVKGGRRLLAERWMRGEVLQIGELVDAGKDRSRRGNRADERGEEGPGLAQRTDTEMGGDDADERAERDEGVDALEEQRSNRVLRKRGQVVLRIGDGQMLCGGNQRIVDRDCSQRAKREQDASQAAESHE